MPTLEDDRLWGSTVTFDARRPPGRRDERRDGRTHRVDDVLAARSAVRNTNVAYGPPDPRRPDRPTRPSRKPSRTFGDWFQGFVHRYGWRAYALPVLSIVTVAALLTGGSTAVHHPRTKPVAATPSTQSAHVSTPPPVASSQIELKHDSAPTTAALVPPVSAAALPAGAAYTQHGLGTYRILKGTSRVIGHGKLFRFSIDVENGITGINLTQFQKMVVQVLSDRRSWTGHGIALQRVDSGPIDFHVTLTSSYTVRSLCGYSIPVETSCYQRAGAVAGLNVNRVVMNDSRWVRGSAAYLGDLNAYRIYMINHEDGHALGHMHAHQCLPGGLAPVMMQQTFGLRSATTHRMCGANPWPYPSGVKGAPGAEQPDTAANDEYGLAD